MSQLLQVRDLSEFFGVLTAILFFSLFIISVQAQDPMKIGVILPLTGPTAVIGQEEKRGVDMGIEKINGAGGALKKKVELIIEDNKGDPTAIVSAAEKLVTRDKVVALSGGYSSVESLALLAAMKKYEPVTVWQGGGVVKMDQMYGKERWFFMLRPPVAGLSAEYHDFLSDIQPKPKRIAIVYEDTLTGWPTPRWPSNTSPRKGSNWSPLSPSNPELSISLPC